MLRLRILSVSLIVGLLSGCTWVKLEPAAEDILVLKPEQTKECDVLRRTTSQVADKVGFINRNPKKMATELETLARNTAKEFGANAIAPESEVKDGKQTFVLLDCTHLR